MDFAKQIQTDADALDAARTEWAEANSTYLKALHGQAPGTAGLDDEEAKRRADQDYLPTLREAEALVAKRASVAEANARAFSRKLGQPQPRLTDAETAVAGHYRAFAEGEAKTLPLAQLASKAAAALRSGGKPEVYAWLEPIRARLAEDPPPMEEFDADVQAARSELNGFLSAARALLIDTRDDALRSELTKARTGAQDVKRDAGRRAQAGRRYSFQTANDVPWEDPAD